MEFCTHGMTDGCSCLRCFGSDMLERGGQASASGPHRMQTCVPGLGSTLAFCPGYCVPPENFSHMDRTVSS